jgi:anti-sigma regulatory factor (Ser/Thr protein kinase)
VESILIDTWLGEHESIPVLDSASASSVRARAQLEAEAAGFSREDGARLTNVASELATNQLAHAHQGVIVIRQIERDGVPGVEVIAADYGDGIADPSAALAGTSTRAGLGAGIAAVREFSDEVDFDVRLGEGTCVWARKFREPVPRWREIGIVGRPHPHERVSGDHAFFVRAGSRLTVAVADGLGHGPEARLASSTAIRAVAQHADDALPEVLLSAHALLKDTRGAVMAVARLERDRGEVELASVGNVSVQLCQPRSSQRFSGSSFTLGLRGRNPRVWTEATPVTPWDALVLYTDGVSSKAEVDREQLRGEHPVVLAHQLLLRFGVDHDDALVLVAR